jgi:hypothetical protein
MYKITDYSYDKAKKVGVVIAPSKNKKYKIDIFNKKGEYITSIGAIGYSDYPTYMKTHGKEYADNRRRLYKIRHDKDRSVLRSRGWYSDQILW